MKSLLVWCLALFSFTWANGQDYKLPKTKHYPSPYNSWVSKDSKDQIDKWDNGTTKLEYIDLGKGRKLRKEYFENGTLKATQEVIQEFSIDTISSFDPETYEETVEVIEGYRDIPNGECLEYIKNGGKLATKGQYKDGKPYGKWEVYSYMFLYEGKKWTPQSRAVTISNYNEDGLLEGEYTEYYHENKKGEKVIKLKGQYKVILNEKGKKESRRTGKWLSYNEEGKLLETVIYQQH